MNKLSVVQKEYLLKESEYLRNAYKESVREINILERYSVVITGAIWSWCAVNLNNHEISTALKYLILVPIITTCLFGFRALGVYKNILRIKDHLGALEDKIQLPKSLGFGKNFQSHWLLEFTGYTFWGVLIALSIGIAVFVFVNY